MELGNLFLVLAAPMSSAANGSSRTSTMPMVPWSDGSLERRKARWVVRGFSQRPGLDFDQTFSPVVKPATIRMVLHLAAARDWPVHQLDVKDAFLHGDLTEQVYCQQPSGFV